MKPAMMFLDITKAFLRRPATERYPFERKPSPERLRGRLLWEPAKCTGCSLCAKDCPADAIQIIVLDKKAKRFMLEYHIDRCTYCAQCVHSCRQGCLTMSSDMWELSALSQEPFTLNFISNEGNAQEISRSEYEELKTK
jgi:formate hydrogenlyase subunit 6/NADH:ubiquinone oxidoreductase subunit I